MLEQLRMENFALVKNLELNLSPGLNVLTGETGAGKSLIIDAISLLLGTRASTQYVRAGADKAIVEGYFNSNSAALNNCLEEMGLEKYADEGLLLSREIIQTGKNLCRINGKIIPLNMFQSLGNLLVDIYGQNEQQSLISSLKQLELLDFYGEHQISGVKEIVKKHYEHLMVITKELGRLQGEPGDRDRQIDFYKYQIKEILEAKLLEQEEEELLRRRKVLANGEKLLVGVTAIYNLLFNDSKGTSAYDLLSESLAQFKSLAAIDQSLDNSKVLVENSLYQLEEAVRELRDYIDTVEFEPNEIEKVEVRLEVINNLKRKYGSSIAEIINYQKKVSRTLQEFEECKDLIHSLEQEKIQLMLDYQDAADQLSMLRKRLGSELEKKIQAALTDLDMKETRFCCHFSKKEHPDQNGQDLLEFFISPNPGEPLKSLSKIASGGELARIMLAIKSILAQADEIETLVFDEADSGIGGRAAGAVAQKISRIAQVRQVICVTHSAQIASFADAHFRIFKENFAGRTITKIKELALTERTDELARMLGGSDNFVTALEHAKQLLVFANQEKCV